MLNPTEEYWLGVFEAYKKSKLSQRKYCEKNDLPHSKFRYYFIKFKENNSRIRCKLVGY